MKKKRKKEKEEEEKRRKKKDRKKGGKKERKKEEEKERCQVNMGDDGIPTQSNRFTPDCVAHHARMVWESVSLQPYHPSGTTALRFILSRQFIKD